MNQRFVVQIHAELFIFKMNKKQLLWVQRAILHIDLINSIKIGYVPFIDYDKIENEKNSAYMSKMQSEIHSYK